MKINKLLALSGAFAICFSIASCGATDNDEVDYGEAIVLNVYNCADYICETESEALNDKENQTRAWDDEDNTLGVMDRFSQYMKAKGKNVVVNYSTYETNEDMFNQLRAGGVNYDLICPSDYMIEKLIMNDMILPLNTSADIYKTFSVENYEDYGSNYIHSTFDGITAKDSKGVEHTFSEYSVPYMWGTMGYMYNPEKVDEELVSTWDFLWDTDHKNEASLKDSIRDSYAVAALYTYKEELAWARSLKEKGVLTVTEYNDKVTEIMNRCDDKSLKLIEASLKEAKQNVYEFEVDTGKENIVNGKYNANVCWSGDAVYGLDQADEMGFELRYMVPEEGSNVWFDGWCIPKDSQHPDVALELMNFLCDPLIAYLNMDYVGYTSAIAGQDMWDLVMDWYNVVDDKGTETDEDDEYIRAEDEANGIYGYDLTYFFEGTGITDEDGNEMTSFIVYTDEEYRQLYAQYPNAETVSRCAIMHDFGDQIDKVNSMWISVKGNSISWVILVFLGVVVLLIVFLEVKTSMNKRARKNRAKAK